MSAAELAPNRYARAEREGLCDLFLELGPDAPTLCEGWRTRDLAAHLVVREGRNIVVSAGISLPALAGVTAKAQAKKAKQRWGTLVAEVRSGPPKGSMMRSPKLDGTINTIEFLIHHEDVRRAQPDWTPRDLGAERQEDFWERLAQFGKRLVGKSPVGVVAQHTDGREVTLKEGPAPVTVKGDPVEILVFLYRRQNANVELLGDPANIKAVTTAIKR